MKEILLYGAIGWDVNPLDIARQFQEARGEEVLLRIHSEGGSVHDGNAIIAAIRQHDARVHAQVDGMAFSMAAVIALELRETLSMPEDAWIMFHEVRGGGGQEADLERQLEQMRVMNDSVAEKLSAAMSVTIEEAREMLAEEIWLTGRQAYDSGLVANLLEAHALAAYVKPGTYKRPPEKLSAQQPGQSTDKKQQQKEMKGFFKFFQKDNESSPELVAIDSNDLESEIIAELRKEADQLAATHAAELAARDERHAKDLQSRLEEQRAEHAKELQAAHDSAEEKANAILAQAGHPSIEVLKAEKESADEIVDQYKKLKPGPERTAFARKHAAILMPERV